MENWRKATLMVLGGLAVVVLAIILAPVAVAALGIVAGVAAIFLPIILLVVIIAVVKYYLDRR